MSALNFDPYAALAEIESSMGLRANRAKRANPATVLAPLAPLALSPAPNQKTSEAIPAPSDPRAWQTELAALSPSHPLGGIDPGRWRCLLTDAQWLARTHGEAAAALGWTSSDLFGLDPLPRWGGLADRLHGARRVTLTDTVAHWIGEDETGWLWRRTLTPKPPIWTPF